MQYRRSGRSGLKLPAISLGLWQNFGGDAPYERQRATVRRAFELGITHFDLANNYGPPPGSAEENFGRMLDTDLAGHRDELVISTKAGYDMWPGPYGEWGSRKYLLASLDQSLKRMGLDYVDIFYSHRFDPDTPLEETMGALATAVSVERASSAFAVMVTRPRTTPTDAPASRHRRTTSTADRSAWSIAPRIRRNVLRHRHLTVSDSSRLRKQLLHLGRGTDSELLAEQALAQLILVDCITGIPVRQVDAHDGAMCALAQRLAGDAQEADLERLGESPCTRQPVAKGLERTQA